MSAVSFVGQWARLAMKHPELARTIAEVVGVALKSRNPWRAAMLKFMRNAAPYLSGKLANELSKLESLR